MILTCPHCSTRYFVWSRHFKRSQRPVRCTSCGETWSVTPPEQTPMVLTQALSNTRKDRIYEGRKADLSFSPEAVFRARLDTRRKRRRRLVFMLLGLLGFLGIGGLLFTAYRNRFDLVLEHPRLARAFDGFGMKANVYGLDFQDIKVDHTRGREGDSVVIRGSIVNIDSRARKVLPLRARMLNDEDVELASTEALIDLDELAPEEKVRFRAAFMAVPDDAQRVVLDFVKPQPLKEETMQEEPGEEKNTATKTETVTEPQ